MTLTEPQLRAFLPRLTGYTVWTAALNTACCRFEITTPERLAAFLAQTAHESAGYTRLVEDLNYSAPRLMAVWPRRFPTLESAQPFAHQPEKLANRVYANRLGNGPPESGDGWRFRGRGLIQLTGRLNYRGTGAVIQVPLEQEPERLELPNDAALSAAQWGRSRDLNLLADLNTQKSFDAISRKINGGDGGLLDRRKYWARAKVALA
jgi:putative chitinase